MSPWVDIDLRLKEKEVNGCSHLQKPADKTSEIEDESKRAQRRSNGSTNS